MAAARFGYRTAHFDVNNPLRLFDTILKLVDGKAGSMMVHYYGDEENGYYSGKARNMGEYHSGGHVRSHFY